MFNPNQYFIYGKNGQKPNTFIGGIGAVTNTASLLAIKLGLSVANIKSFKVEAVTNNVSCYIDTTYFLPFNCFDHNTDITFFNDLDGLVLLGNAYCFRLATNLTSVYFPSLTTLNGANFNGCLNLKTVYIPLLEYMGWSCFFGCHSVLHFNFPYLTTAHGSSFANCYGVLSYNLPSLSETTTSFTDNRSLPYLSLPGLILSNVTIMYKRCYKLTELDLPECTTFIAGQLVLSSLLEKVNLPKVVTLGSGAYSIGSWWGTAQGITWTVPIALQTSNNGGVDENLQGLIDDYQAKVIYV